MAELVTQNSLARNIRINGCVQWSSHSHCLLPTAEGMAVLQYTLPVRKSLKIEMSCSSMELSGEVMEPEHLDRQQLNREIANDPDKVQQMKIDRVVCPALRSMGDNLAIRQACWEPTGTKTTYPRLAVLAHKLLIYTYVDYKWQVAINLSHEISDCVKAHPIANNSNDVNEVFKVHSGYVTCMTWSKQAAFAANRYGHLFATTFSPDSGFPGHTCRIETDNINIKGVRCVSHISSTNGEGTTLIIGRLDGTCALINITPELEVTSTKELDLSADYRPVECAQNISNEEVLFIKHTEVCIYNVKKEVMQSFVAKETKYSISHATASSSHVYIATNECGVIVKSRDSGKTVQQLSEAPNWTSHGVALSPSGVLLLSISQPAISDMYITREPLLVKLYKLMPLDAYLKELWQSSELNDVCWDTFLLIGHHLAALPDWLNKVLSSVNFAKDWAALTDMQIRILYIIYHCLVDKSHETVVISPERLHRLATLKLLLSVRHLKRGKSEDPNILQYINHCEQLCKSECSMWNVSHIPNRKCCICGEELKLTSGCIYVCGEGHSSPICSNTMLPISSPRLEKCSQCSAAIIEADDVDDDMRCGVSDLCAYCGGMRLAADD